jgi:hypothetical protein
MPEIWGILGPADAIREMLRLKLAEWDGHFAIDGGIR